MKKKKSPLWQKLAALNLCYLRAVALLVAKLLSAAL
jgi:hypothetical protein